MGFSKSQEIQQNTNEELYFDNEFDEDNIYEEISNIPNQPMIKNDDKEYYTTTEFKFTRNRKGSLCLCPSFYYAVIYIVELSLLIKMSILTILIE